MCETACPVRINTGDLVRKLRVDESGTIERATWNISARRWAVVTRVASRAMSTMKRMPAGLITGPNRLARLVLGTDLVPLWSRDLPAGGASRNVASRIEAPTPDAVYFSACVGTMFGPAEGHGGVALALDSLAVKAGINLVRPAGLESLCCGTPWKSKGMQVGYDEMVAQTVDALWLASDGGRLNIVCDNSSCSEGLVGAVKSAASRDAKYSALNIVDAVDFAATVILPRVRVGEKLASVVVHPTCSSTRAGSNVNLLAVANACAHEAVVPDAWGCCGFAGDRGMLHPELTASATDAEAREIADIRADAHVSCNRTCEIGMTRATGAQYVHVLETLDALALTRERKLP
jgi:D-lactate dehydrogenase